MDNRLLADFAVRPLDDRGALIQVSVENPGVIDLVYSTPVMEDEAGGVAAVVNALASGFSARPELKIKSAILCNKGKCDGAIERVGLKDLARRSPPDLLHDHGLWLPFHVAVWRFANRRRVPLIVSVHGMLDPWPRRQKRWKKIPAWLMYQKKILNSARLVVANSERERRNLRSIGVVAPVAVIPNGIDSRLLRGKRCGAQEGVDRTPRKQALFFSRINPVKGILELLDAWKASSAPERYGYRLSIYGNCDDEAYLALVKRKISDLSLNDSVVIKGAVYGHKRWKVFDEHDFLVLPSYNENFGLVVIEALARGLPVLTSDQTPWAILGEEGLGETVPVDSVSLTHAIDRFIGRFERGKWERSEFIKRSSEFIENRYLWAEIIQCYRDAYLWVLGQGGMPGFVDLHKKRL